MSPPASFGPVPALWVRDAELLWTGVRELTDESLSAMGGRVSAIGGPVPPDAEVLDASGCIVTPGLVNAHHHLLQSAFRTIPATRHLPMRDWLSEMAAAYRAARVDPELQYAAASVGVAEGLLDGVTTVADHHLVWPPGADLTGLALATATAATSLGARLVFVRGTAGDDPQQAAEHVEQLAQALGVGLGGCSPDGLIQLAVGPAGVHSDGPEAFRLMGEVASRLGLRRRTQANEQVDVERAVERYGRRPLELLDEWGWLDRDVTLAHLCGITAAEVDRLARAQVTVTHAPGCDLPSGWGVAPVGALLDRGIPVGLGTSGGGSNDAGHLLADARLALQVAPLAPLPPAALTARQVLSMATRGSAVGLGRHELGHLEVGAAADLCCWDVTGVADAGGWDRSAGLIWANPGRRPRHVVVRGRLVVRDGQLIAEPERAVAQRLSAVLADRLGS